MVEVQLMCQMRIGGLLIGQLDIEAHRNAIRLAGPSVYRFHDAGPTARQHGQTGAAQPRSQPLRALICRIIGCCACTTKYRDAAGQLTQ